MGSSVWNPGAYASYTRSVASAPASAIFTNTSGCHKDLNPLNFKVRESCDSPANPLSTPIIIGVDETGSMGKLATEIIKGELGTIVQGIRDRKPVTDPHVLLAAIGDASCDSAAIQTTQFETDMKLVEQIEKFYIEGNGGGNGGESYPILWYFARYRTACDAITKRGKRGYLFTVGDEAPLNVLTKAEIKQFFGEDVESDMKIADLLQEAQTRWNVFHLITPTGSTGAQDAVRKWKDLLGERAVVVDDYKRLGAVIVSIMQVNEGQDAATVAGSWGGDTGLVVQSAIQGLSRGPRVTAKVESV